MTARRATAAMAVLRPATRVSRRQVVARGGFKTVELNAAGWTALLGVGGASGALVAILVVRTPEAVAASSLMGAGVSYAIARVRDELRDRRRVVNVAVRDGEQGAQQLRAAGIKASGDTHVDAEGVLTAYVSVYARDVTRARQLVGAPRTSRRSGRRARDVEFRAQRLPKLRPES